MVNKVVMQSKFKIYFRILYFEGITCWVMPSTVLSNPTFRFFEEATCKYLLPFICY